MAIPIECACSDQWRVGAKVNDAAGVGIIGSAKTLRKRRFAIRTDEGSHIDSNKSHQSNAFGFRQSVPGGIAGCPGELYFSLVDVGIEDIPFLSGPTRPRGVWIIDYWERRTCSHCRRKGTTERDVGA